MLKVNQQQNIAAYGRTSTPVYRTLLMAGLTIFVFAHSSLSATPSVTWVSRFGGPGGNGGSILGGEIGRAVDVDSRGNVVAVATYYETTTISGAVVTLTSAGNTDIAVVKINSTGQLVWARSFGGQGADASYDISCGDRDTIYISGNTTDSVKFGSHVVIGSFIAKIDPDGHNATAFRTWRTPNEHVIDKQGNIFTACKRAIEKYNPTGQRLWSVSVGDSSDDGGRGICLTDDGTGDVIVAGQYVSETILLKNGTNEARAASYGLMDGFVARISSDGMPRWVRTVGGSGMDNCRGVAMAGGDIWLAGTFTDSARLGDTTIFSHGSTDIYIARCNGSAVPLWIRALGSDSHDEGAEISVNAAGYAVIGGSFRSTITTAYGTVFSAGENDHCIAKYGPDGSLAWVLSPSGGAGSDMAYACGIDESGAAFFCGYFTATARFGTLSVTSAGKEDVVVGKIVDNVQAVIDSNGFGAADANTLLHLPRPGAYCSMTGYFPIGYHSVYNLNGRLLKNADRSLRFAKGFAVLYHIPSKGLH